MYISISCFFRSFSRKTQAAFAFVFLVSKVLFRSSICFNFSSVNLCLGSIVWLPAAFREMSLRSYSRRPQGCYVTSVSVWFRSKTGFPLLVAQKINRESPPSRSFTRPIFRALFDSRFLFFSPKPHGNANRKEQSRTCESGDGKSSLLNATLWSTDTILLLLTKADLPMEPIYLWHFFMEWVPFLY